MWRLNFGFHGESRGILFLLSVLGFKKYKIEDISDTDQ
jgi:hypothetical protein